MLGTTEIVVIVAAGLVLFGASAVPKFARSLGQAKKEFKKGLKDGEEEQAKGDDENDESSEKGKK